MFFCTSQIDNVSMSEVTCPHVEKKLPALGWNLMKSPRVSIESMYLGPNGPRYLRLKHSETALNFSSPGQEYIIRYERQASVVGHAIMQHNLS